MCMCLFPMDFFEFSDCSDANTFRLISIDMKLSLLAWHKVSINVSSNVCEIFNELPLTHTHILQYPNFSHNNTRKSAHMKVIMIKYDWISVSLTNWICCFCLIEKDIRNWQTNFQRSLPTNKKAERNFVLYVQYNCKLRIPTMLLIKKKRTNKQTHQKRWKYWSKCNQHDTKC